MTYDDDEDGKLDYGQLTLDLKRDGFNSDKEIASFTKKCVGLVRQTPEYRDWTDYVKDMLGYKTCALTNENADEITIEIHHHPLTLHDVVSIVLSTYLSTGKKFTSLDIVKDTLYLHYSDKIGFIPLVASLHEKYHNGFLIIPPKLIHGTWDHLLVTPGFEVTADIVSKCNDLMKVDNNKYDTYLNWQNQGGVV